MFRFLFCIACAFPLASVHAQFRPQRQPQPAPVAPAVKPVAPAVAPPAPATPAAIEPVDAAKPPHLQDRNRGVVAPPQVDREEIIRRGNMVQPMGTIQQGPVDLIADALAPPKDDSDKWFIFVITKDGEQKSELLKQHFGKSKLADGTDNPLQSWVKPTDHEKSYAHYNVIRWEDSDPERGVFKDWFAGIREQIKTGTQQNGFPVVLLQPPKNGKSGPNKTVVAMIFGYDGNPNTMAGHLRYAQHSYLQTIIKNGKIFQYRLDGDKRDGLIKQQSEDAEIISDPPATAEPASVGSGQQAPFNVPTGPLNPLMPISPGADIPPMPQYLSLQQVQQMLPGAPPDYILRVMSMNPTVQQASMIANQWMIDKETVLRKQETESKNASAPLMPSLLTLLATGNFAGLIGIGAMLWRNMRQKKGETVLDDKTFWYIMNALGIEKPAANGGPASQLPPIQIVRREAGQ